MMTQLMNWFDTFNLLCCAVVMSMFILMFMCYCYVCCVVFVMLCYVMLVVTLCCYDMLCLLCYVVFVMLCC